MTLRTVLVLLVALAPGSCVDESIECMMFASDVHHRGGAVDVVLNPIIGPEDSLRDADGNEIEVVEVDIGAFARSVTPRYPLSPGTDYLHDGPASAFNLWTFTTGTREDSTPPRIMIAGHSVAWNPRLPCQARCGDGMVSVDISELSDDISAPADLLVGACAPDGRVCMTVHYPTRTEAGWSAEIPYHDWQEGESLYVGAVDGAGNISDVVKVF